MNKGMTSVEAAAMLISGGQTKDPEKAEIIAQGRAFDEDGLMRAHLRRRMGFDFTLEVKDNRFVLTDLETKRKASCFYSVLDEKAVKRLVRACMRLKKLHDNI